MNIQDARLNPSTPLKRPISISNTVSNTILKRQNCKPNINMQNSTNTTPATTATTNTSRIMSDDEQILIINLQETYKAILQLEIESQHGCAKINQKLRENNAGPELNNELWALYKTITHLLDNYYDFLLYALSPTSKTGKPLVNNYRILKRMWVYGIVSFLEVLKSVIAVFVEHEICACFISYSFNIISCLIDPELGIESWWNEKLGDLSRMAIALYPARYMDWKISSIYWYNESIKTQFGHGKIYYHLCSVENDNLKALMLIGKAVNCRDPFVPTNHYLRMIIDNVCSERNLLTHIELSMIDFVKIHKILLLPNYNINTEMIKIVSHYSSNFGVDNTNIDFFQIRLDSNSIDVNDKIKFWFQKGPDFALSNIYHLLGLGSISNPFAKLFDLPLALKERKDKKDRRDKRRKSKSDDENDDQEDEESTPDTSNDLINSTAGQISTDFWFVLLNETNKGVIELSMKMLKQYLSGPVQTSTSHVLVWLYFLTSVIKSLEIYPNAKPMFQLLLKAIFPWKILTLYLNDLLCVVRSVPELISRYRLLLQKLHPNLLFTYFGSNETLWEVWKCWGSIWFDRINLKLDYDNVFQTGIKNDIFDVPLSGEIYNSFEDGERFIRILLLANYIVTSAPELGLIISDNLFKYNTNISTIQSEISSENKKLFNDFMNDSRMSQLVNFSGYTTNTTSEIIPCDDFNINSWTNANISPKLPMWDHNSYGFMTDYINNQYPAVLAHKKSNTGNVHNHNNEDNEHEEDSESEYEDEDDEDDEEEEEKKKDNKNSEIVSDSASIGANVPLTTIEQLTELSDAGNDNTTNDKEIIDKKVKIRGDIGELSDTSITFISLDTNVWLKHCGKIFKCVRSRIFKLAIPLTVFQELRSLRKSNDNLVAESATRAVIIARQLYAEHVVLAIRSDGTTATNINETREFENNENWRLNSDELILQSIKLNDAFGKNLCLGYGYSIGELPELPTFEEPGKITGIYNGSYQGGYSFNYFPTSNPNSVNTEIANNNNEVHLNDQINEILESSSNYKTKNWNLLNKSDYNSIPINTTGLRGESTRSLFIGSKRKVLSKLESTEFCYNIIVSDDRDMAIRAQNINLKLLSSDQWFRLVDKIAFGRCLN